MTASAPRPSARPSPGPSPRAAPLSSLRLLLPMLRPYLLRTILAVVALLLAAALTLSIGQGLALLVNRSTSAGGAEALNAASALMGFIVIALGLATASRYYMITWLGERVAADLRKRVHHHVLTLSPAWFDTMRTGDILSRMTADVALLQGLVGSALSMGLRNLLTGSGALVLMALTSPRLAAAVVVVLPMIVVPLVLFGRRERRLSRSAQERVADLAARAEETLNGLRVVQAFTQVAAERERFAEETEESVAAALRRIATRSLLILAVILLGFGTITAALYAGALEVISGRMSGGDLAAFVFYAIMAATAGATISELWGEIQRAAAAADRLLEILAVEPAIAAPASPVPMPDPPQRRLAFEDVVFAYPTRPQHRALDGVSLRVEPGETVALVGPSGAGKTTIFQLVLRFYDPQGGRILVDGVDVRDADPEAVRARIGLVPQDPLIFAATARENIRYGRPDATDAEIRRAAEAAAAHDFIAALPEGYDTRLGTRGVTLSGGQRQRIAVARAILKDAPILLLDEATSALDAESERLVQAALERLSRGRTTLVVAHRLATVRRADRILVIDDGRIVAEGPHDRLVREGGLYARLAALQFADAA
ncbi:ABC transporter transmembrane domain-containing protein [Falsiroseomonas sp. HW251]|uniref:ABC transporter transmembrane domain-containing protein n=1 Tax=Falsiroseomonas sp. HW251 TaxID=3390998 RepID=UPI003D31A0D7